MRLYFLLNTGLLDAEHLESPPEAGDVICYFRAGQDLTGTHVQQVRERGIEVIFADSLLDEADNRRLDKIGTIFLRDWFRPGGEDFTDLGDISVGLAYSMELARQTNPRVVIRFGEILRRLLERHPDTAAVLTDVRDGNGIFEVEAAYLPLRQVLKLVANRNQLRLIPLAPINSIPPALRRPRHSNWTKTVKSLLGGLRPHWLLARFRCLCLRLNSRSGPILYMILGRGHESMATHIAQNGRLRVVANRRGVPGTYVLRSEQVLAVPRITDIFKASSVLKRLSQLSSQNSADDRFTVGGIDYAPILFGAARAVIASQIWPFLIVVAQSRRLHRMLNYQALFVAGAGAEFMGNLVALDKSSGRKVYLMPHGMDLQRFAYLMPGSDRQHVTYLAYGTDHQGFYVSDGGPGLPLRVVQTGNPLTTDMNKLRSLPRPEHRKRLLVLSFGHLPFWNADRIYAVDRYYADLFTVSRTLIAEGWQVGLRPHPSHPYDLEKRIAEQFGIGGDIEWNTGESFETALAGYDVTVCSASTTFYQSLFAGRPTIFYEPAYRQGKEVGLENHPMMTGLITAGDIRRPVTSDPKVLEEFIRSSEEKDSFVSAFPKRFATELAPRFIGPCPETADQFAAEFIEQDILQNPTGSNPGSPVERPSIRKNVQTESSYT